MKKVDKIGIIIMFICIVMFVVMVIHLVEQGKEPVTIKEASSIEQPCSATWISVPDSVCTDTIVFLPYIEGLRNTYIQVKIVGMGGARAKIHVCFPNADSSWHHFIIE